MAEVRQDADDPLLGEVLANRYQLQHRLGEGAMGAVYRATHVKVGRPFAVKILHKRLLDDAKVAERFEREAELAGRLHHPNVIGVVDVGEIAGRRYMVMDYAEGVDLANLLNDAPMPAPRVLHMTRQLLDGLYHAHEQGLIHRDFKPENVIVERDDHGDEVPRIVDFGIAILREAGDSAAAPGRLTTNGLVLGTPHYMAPEQAVADPIDHRIDLFALGIIVYEMLSGKLPFDGTGAEVARANLLLDPPPIAQRVPFLEVDPLLEAFSRKLMAKRREQRPPTAKAARELLDLIALDPNAAADALGIPRQTNRGPLTTAPVVALAAQSSGAIAAAAAAAAAAASTAATSEPARAALLTPPPSGPPVQAPSMPMPAPPATMTASPPPPPTSGGALRIPSSEVIALSKPKRAVVTEATSPLAWGPGDTIPKRKRRGLAIALFLAATAVVAVGTVIAIDRVSDSKPVVKPAVNMTPGPTDPSSGSASSGSGAGSNAVALAGSGSGSAAQVDSGSDGSGSAGGVVALGSSGSDSGLGSGSSETEFEVPLPTHPTIAPNPGRGSNRPRHPVNPQHPVTMPSHDPTVAKGSDSPSPTIPTPSTNTGSAAVTQPVTPLTTPSPTTPPQVSAADIAKLYTEVGQEIAAIEKTKGQDAAVDLWQRYRRIQLGVAMGQPPDQRAATAAQLQRIRADAHHK